MLSIESQRLTLRPNSFRATALVSNAGSLDFFLPPACDMFGRVPFSPIMACSSSHASHAMAPAAGGHLPELTFHLLGRHSCPPDRAGPLLRHVTCSLCTSTTPGYRNPEYFENVVTAVAMECLVEGLLKMSTVLVIFRSWYSKKGRTTEPSGTEHSHEWGSNVRVWADRLAPRPQDLFNGHWQRSFSTFALHDLCSCC